MITLNFGCNTNPNRLKVKAIEDRNSITFDPSKLWSWMTDRNHPAPDGQDRESKEKQAAEDRVKEQEAKAKAEAEKNGKK